MKSLGNLNHSFFASVIVRRIASDAMESLEVSSSFTPRDASQLTEDEALFLIGWTEGLSFI